MRPGRPLLWGALGALIALAAVVAIVGAGHGGGSDRPAVRAPRERPSDGDLITALLSRRAAAWERHDARALAATTASGRLRRADRRALRNLGAVRLRDMRYETGSLTLSGPRARIETVEAYRLEGVPTSRFGVPRVYRAERRSGVWRLTSERRGRERQPWDLGPVREVLREHVLLIAPRGLGVGGVSRIFARAYRTVARRLPVPPGPRYVVVVARDLNAARRMTPRISGLESLVAIADADVRQAPGSERPLAVVSQRLVLIWPGYEAQAPAGRLRVLEHELTHLVTARVTSGLTPSWLVEGLALYVSGDRRVAEAARLLDLTVADGAGGAAADAAHRVLALTVLSAPDALARLAGPAQTAAYAYASSAAFYIAARYGRTRLLRLYRIFGADDLPGAAGPEITDAAVSRVLGLRLVDLERNLRRWILTRAALFPQNP
jgi:hypothetical protein